MTSLGWDEIFSGDEDEQEETENSEFPVDNIVRRFTVEEIQNAIRKEIEKEYSLCLDKEEMNDKIYEITGLVTKALENT